MPGKCRRDDKKVFKAIKKRLPCVNVQIRTFDFEAAMWEAFSSASTNVTILGCFPHYSQGCSEKCARAWSANLPTTLIKTH